MPRIEIPLDEFKYLEQSRTSGNLTDHEDYVMYWKIGLFHKMSDAGFDFEKPIRGFEDSEGGIWVIVQAGNI